jgi:NAD(P)-dependent dehydrogenase (short-subunit alcohol dehydrogenase family)
MRVVLADIEEQALAAAVMEIKDLGGDVIGQVTDVSSWDDVTRLAEITIGHFGQVNVVCNNAGVSRGGRFETIDLDVWRWVLDVDLWGVIHGVKAFLPLIEQQGEGHVVNTSSALGLYTRPVVGPYAAAKFAVVALSEVLAQELDARDSPIKVSCLCPGPTKSNLQASERNQPDYLAGRAAAISPEDLAYRENALRIKSEMGLEPDTVGLMVIRAIEDERFWIITHPEVEAMARERGQAIGLHQSVSSRPAFS